MTNTIQDTFNHWSQQADLPSDLKNSLADLQQHPSELADAFGAKLSFGTAGMRGKLGAGPNRMNIYTVRQATMGLARFMNTLPSADQKRGVAISYDSRHQSKTFALQAALVLATNGIPAFIFDSMRPTPELSFAVRHLNTYAGIMITASHNPKEYNGFKLYGPDGGQMPPVAADNITNFINQITDVFTIEVANEALLKQKGLFHLIGEDVDQAYLKAVQSVLVDHELINKMGSDLKFVYTPLHGTGNVIARRALTMAGFTNYQVVAEQCIADPDFSTTPFPNPEFAQVFDLAKQIGQDTDAELLIATDPDADRLGAAVRQPDGSYKLLSGNQIASILLHYLLVSQMENQTLPSNGAVIKSIVSTDLATKIANNYHISTINVLTGFKFIAENIQQFEVNHDYTFLFGFEESYGYLIKPFVRDKDAIQTTLLLAEVAAYYKAKGQTLYDGIEAIFKQYGYFAEKTISKQFEGLAGAQKISHIMTTLREHPLTTFNNQPIVKVADYQSQTVTADVEVTSTNLPVANVLKYWLADGTWLTVRPSGTEPKIKFYLETNADSEAVVNTKMAALTTELNQIITNLTN